MDTTEKEKLKVLLNHWIEHNTEHAQEYTEWAEKAKYFGQVAVHDDIKQAVQQMNTMNALLLKALERLKEG
jgi:hypothetical protein